jgi:hypothetical protein
MKRSSRNILISAAITGTLAGALLAACGPGAQSTTPAAPVAPATSLSAPAVSTTEAPAAAATGPLGTVLTVTTNDPSTGQDSSYEITAVEVDQHSRLVPYDSLSNPANHLAAVKFRITGVTGDSSDDAYNDATAITTDSNQVQSGLNGTPDGGDFNNGTFTVGPGQTVTGWITFEIPPGQVIAYVQWAPGFSGHAGTWTV